MRSVPAAAFGLALAVLIAACGGNGPDATGEPQSGPHPYDHYPAASDVWVQNPDVATTSEYWTIFRQENGTHYMIPRPDGSPFLIAACASDDAVGTLLQATAVCQSTSTSAQVQRVNALTVDEAITISTVLHDGLTFTAGPNGVEPFALISDRVEVCRALGDPGALADLCAWELGRATTADTGGLVTDIARVLTSDEAVALAAELNVLYGT